MKCARCAAVSNASIKNVATLAGPEPSVPRGKISAYLAASLVVAEMEIRKLRHDPTELFTRAVQPALWLLVFGQAFSRIRAIPTGGVSYQTFMTPGILAQSMMFIAIFYGLSIIWDRDQGILQKLLAMPVPRTAFVTGKALGAGIRALAQVAIILFLALVLRLEIRWSVKAVAFSILTVMVGAMFFATLSMVLAALVKTRERFMGIGQVITMPLFFASNALYPIAIMPAWLQVLATINPLSYIVELLRGYLLGGAMPRAGHDWLVLLGVTVIIQVIAARLYPRIVT
ncbi:ABC transporter permease [Moorella sp. Hama-1]|uniref:ABC transporter permease n=1 Tax=Moorella sp. Hama-1 TaxID=2138101 RepID=UPI000D6594A7|nr:ABC transporter permease [Moorella sp. Hama-1]BCV22398.1 transport permease protein [Moorella sp. Hama-1]